MQQLNDQNCSVQPANVPVWSKVVVIKPQLEVMRCWQQDHCDLLSALASAKAMALLCRCKEHSRRAIIQKSHRLQLMDCAADDASLLWSVLDETAYPDRHHWVQACHALPTAKIDLVSNLGRIQLMHCRQAFSS